KTRKTKERGSERISEDKTVLVSDAAFTYIKLRAEARLPCSSGSLIILSFSLYVKDHNLMPLVDIFKLTTDYTVTITILLGTQKNTVPRATVT
ncbi:hypothetical protein C0J52_05556, partial [Blattella germanica]